MSSEYYLKIPSLQNGKCYDPDSSPKAWEYYRKVYSSERWNLLNEFDLEHVDTYNNLFMASYDEGEYKRLLAPIKKDSSLYGERKLCTAFTFGGDTDFNFNKDEWINGKFREGKNTKFKRKIRDDKNALSMLEECAENHHSLVNFSLIARTGNLQGVKSMGFGDRLDRLDSFFTLLKQFFHGNAEHILQNAKSNRKPLECFLSMFVDVYDYCAKVYFIQDRDFVDRMIYEGQKPIRSSEDTVRYMVLAKEYWKRKETYLLSLFPHQ